MFSYRLFTTSNHTIFPAGGLLAILQQANNANQQKKEERRRKRRKPTQYYHFEDGSIDLFIAAVVLQIGLSILLSRLGYSGAWAPLAVFALCGSIYVSLFYLWKRVVLERLGIINIVPISKNKFVIFFIFGSVFVVLAAVLGVIISSQPAMGQTSISAMLLRGLPIFILLCVGGFLFEILRFFLYAFLIAAVFPLGAYLDMVTGWSFTYPLLIIGTAVIIAAIGIFYFISFLRSHPR